MDKLMRVRNYHHPKSKQITKVKRRKPIKVVYISSPTMVKASNEAEFRALVQELTGRNSDDRSFSPTTSSEVETGVTGFEIPRRTVVDEIVYDDDPSNVMSLIDFVDDFFLTEALNCDSL
uniref:VQ domain-containing protein n=1 Tax=Nelumbo nucifera TaxID=4432 RepID=A0A822YVJ6_NELNU|nr:TPA_asm: hypothetical protein HUJ06_007353 [Nelumbo nucifera]